MAESNEGGCLQEHLKRGSSQTYLQSLVDVSSALLHRLFPKAVAPNVHLLRHSVTSLPASWTNKFSFINQRSLVAALRIQDWPVALQELQRTLLPGGQVQLTEPAYIGVSREGGKPLPPPSACARFSAVFEDTFAHSGHDAFCATSRL